jgi:leucyl/phenylalanyl-tRNA--protein transferase
MEHDPEDDGIVEWSNDLSVERLIWAYSNGIFPWPIPGAPKIPWVTPPKRGILRFSKLNLPKSLKKWLKNHPYQVTINKDFKTVIEQCADRGPMTETWITSSMIEAYNKLHHFGYAHSFEVWEQDQIVGGLYGVYINGVFSGESMFHRRPNTSKLALLHLIQFLTARGTDWIDIQILTPHLEALGAESVSRDEFYALLRKTQQNHHHKPSH